MSRHGYRGDGAFGQFCLVLPEQDAVIAITSSTGDMQAVLDAVWAHALPAFGEPGSAAADAALARRLAGLRLPARGSAAGSRLEAPVCLAPEGGLCEALPVLRVVRATDRHLTLDDGQMLMRLPVAAGRWHVTEDPVPAAASGGWTGPATLEFDVIFLETPHRLMLTCALRERTFRARWSTRPLGSVDSLRRLGAPRAEPEGPRLPGSAADGSSE
jgi:hypothetical protein